MDLLPLEIDQIIEKVIKQMQDNDGYITKENLTGYFTDYFDHLGLGKMLAFGLIAQHETVEYMYRLTDKGWNFESIAIEKETARLQREKLKYEVANAERINITYWWTFGFAVLGFGFSLVLLILKLKELAD